MNPALREILTHLLADPESNPNHMGQREYQMLVNNITSEGFLQPVLVRALVSEESSSPNLYEIIDGVHRVRAARDVGLSTVPAVVLPYGYPDEKAKLLQVGMNRLRGELDLTEVAHQLAELGDGVDISLAGFTEAELAGLLRAVEPSPEDLAVELGSEQPDRDIGQATFTLEVQLGSAAELRKVKQVLRRAAGKMPDASGPQKLAAGLRRALGLEEP